MATILITKEEAERKLADAGIPRDVNGNYHIIQVLQILGLLHIKEERLVMDIVNDEPVIIKRNGKIIYEE